MLDLTDDELYRVTKKHRRRAQAKALDFMQIPYRVRPDGSLLVLRDALQAPLATAKVPAGKPFEVRYE